MKRTNIRTRFLGTTAAISVALSGVPITLHAQEAQPSGVEEMVIIPDAQPEEEAVVETPKDADPEATEEGFVPETEPDVSPDLMDEAGVSDPLPEPSQDETLNEVTEPPVPPPLSEVPLPPEVQDISPTSPPPEPEIFEDPEPASEPPVRDAGPADAISLPPSEEVTPPAAAASEEAQPQGQVTRETISEDSVRSSSQDFSTSASGERRKGQKSGLSDLEKVGLGVIGGLAVGALLNNGDEVVSNTGDRVVVQQNEGDFVVLKDDDALLRQPGNRIGTETFEDGSTRTTVEQSDGTRVVTIRDATGRVLRRTKIDHKGQEVKLFDDTVRSAPVDVRRLPPREEVRISPSDDTALRAALRAIKHRENARTFSLRQIRDYPQVRKLAPVLDVDSITFRTGSAAIETSQAQSLSELGRMMREMIRRNPREVFLIEGHTDAVGSAFSNLTLSDRRAESVALALTEYFDVPPENLVVQGYGESDLRIRTEAEEPRNRRVSVRVITPLLYEGLLPSQKNLN